MKRILRVGLMVLLTAVLGVGNARGEWKVWKDGNGMQWKYEEIEPGKTCSIWPKDINSISGRVDIPYAVEEGRISIKVVSIGEWAFSACSGLTAVTIPASVTEIGGGAFKGCSRLKEVVIPASVSKIGACAFYGCSGLTEVTIPEGVTEIGERAFKGCSRLKEVVIPASVTKIGMNAFYGCSRLKAVSIPEGVTEILWRTFSGCSSLTDVTIPSSVTKIERDAFYGCSGLTAVTIPSSVTKIDDGAFTNCSGLKAFTVDEENASYCSEGGVLFTKDKKALIHYPGGKAGKYRIPSCVNDIRPDAFHGCSSLTEVTIPNDVMSIADGVFSDCSDLQSIAVETGNENYCAVDGVLFTKDKTILKSYPGGKAGSYRISSGVKSIERGAFWGCSKLEALEVEEGNEKYCAVDGVLFTKEMQKLICYPAGKRAEKYTIPDGVPEIESMAFYGCRGLSEVIIPIGVTTIEGWAFCDCSGLTRVTILAGVTVVGEEAFEYCAALSEVYWLAGAGCEVEYSALREIARPATLYVRQGEKEAIERKLWAHAFSEVVEGYVVTLKDSDGTRLGEQLVKPNGKADEPKAPTRTGFTFMGWYLDGAKYKFSEEVTQDITLVEVWKQNYTVTFNAKGGAPTPGEQTVVEDGTAAAPTAPTKAGYTFMGWYLDGAKYVFTTPVTKDITLVAQWEAESTAPQPSVYTVSFNANGGAPTPNTQQVAPNGTADEPKAPTRTGFIFKGWYLDGVKYVFTMPVTRSITLEAQWEAGENKPNNTETAVESVELSGVRVVQNPVGEVLELEGMERAVRVEVYSASGVRVHAESLHGAERVEIDAWGWASGMYVVRVVASDGAKTLRVVK